jgi:hypothetical protein
LWPVEGESERLRAEKRLVDDILVLARGVSHDACSPEEPAIGFLGFDQPSVRGLENGSGVGSASDSEVSEGVGSERRAASVASFDVSSTCAGV